MELKEAIKGITVTVAEVKKDKDGKDVRKVMERPAVEKDVLAFNEKAGIVVTCDGQKHRISNLIEEKKGEKK